MKTLLAILLLTACAVAQSSQTIKKSQLTAALATKQVRALRSQMGDPDSLKVNAVFFTASEMADGSPPQIELCVEFRGRNQMGGFSVYHWFWNERQPHLLAPWVAGSEADDWDLACVAGKYIKLVTDVTPQVRAVLKADRAKNNE